MIKQLKLIALFLAVSLIQPVHAGEKMSRVKDGANKVANIIWHVGEIGAGCFGCYSVITLASNFAPKFQTKNKSNSPEKTIENSNEYADVALCTIGTIGSLSLLNQGLRGLNRELRPITKKFLKTMLFLVEGEEVERNKTE